jgi:hypothetical protein
VLCCLLLFCLFFRDKYRAIDQPVIPVNVKIKKFFGSLKVNHIPIIAVRISNNPMNAKILVLLMIIFSLYVLVGLYVYGRVAG